MLLMQVVWIPACAGMTKLMDKNFAIQSTCRNNHKTKPAKAGLFFGIA